MMALDDVMGYDLYNLIKYVFFLNQIITSDVIFVGGCLT